MTTLHQAKKSDIPTAAAMAALLFEGSTIAELSQELEALLNSGEGVVFLLSVDHVPVGFAQC